MISITISVDVMLLAEAHNCCDLEQAALNFVCQNLKNVALSSDSFLDLPLEKMMSLLDMEVNQLINPKIPYRRANNPLLILFQLSTD